MQKRFVPILGVAAVLAGAFFACSRVPPAPRGKPGPGAFDVVKMGRFGIRQGPIYFAHDLHADLPGLDGRTLPCSACHFETCGPPRRCGECHLPTKRGSKAKLPST